MSRSQLAPTGPIPPEVTAIVVAIAALLSEQALEEAPAEVSGGAWRLSGQRWGRPVGHRWS